MNYFEIYKKILQGAVYSEQRCNRAVDGLSRGIIKPNIRISSALTVLAPSAGPTFTL